MNTADDHEARMANLEREQRRLRRRLRQSVAALLAALVALCFMTYVQLKRGPAEIRAGRFIVVDEHGDTRAELGMDESTHEPRFRLLYGDGRPSITITSAAPPWAPAERSGPGIAIHDGAGKPRVWLGVDAKDGGLMIADPSGRPRLALASDTDFHGLTVFDEERNPRARFRLSEHDDASVAELVLMGRQHKEQAALKAASGGWLSLHGSDGHEVFSAPRE